MDNSLVPSLARAKRLKKARNMANLNRYEICNVSYLNLNTYKGWEIARHGGLSKKGALLVIERLSDEGVICSLEWLLDGKGQQPYIIPKTKGAGLSPENENIQKELMLFASLHRNAIYTRLSDNALEPVYKNGDFVAGILYDKDNLDKAVDKICIIQTKTGELLTRLLKKDNINGNYLLLSTNLNESKVVISNVSINGAAPILRHYKTTLFFL